MENPIDHTVDLGFVNYVAHPKDRNYVVFRFVDQDRSSDFKARLEAAKIWFEQSDDVKRGQRCDLYAIHHTDFKKVAQINYDVEAAHKKPILKHPLLRYGLLLFFFVCIALAIVVYMKRPQFTEPSTIAPAESKNPAHSTEKP